MSVCVGVCERHRNQKQLCKHLSVFPLAECLVANSLTGLWKKDFTRRKTPVSSSSRSWTLWSTCMTWASCTETWRWDGSRSGDKQVRWSRLKELFSAEECQKSVMKVWNLFRRSTELNHFIQESLMVLLILIVGSLPPETRKVVLGKWINQWLQSHFKL